MKKLKIIATGVTLSTLVGCASIAGDNSRNISVTSYPAGAAVIVDNQQFATTPATITLPTYIYGGKSITLKKRGYQDTTMMVNSTFQPISLVNILFWPGFIVDAVTGSLVKIDPASKNIRTTLHHV